MRPNGLWLFTKTFRRSVNTVINPFAEIFRTGLLSQYPRHTSVLLTVVPDQKAVENNTEHMGGPFEEKLVLFIQVYPETQWL